MTWGRGRLPVDHVMKGDYVPKTIEERIAVLLDQLESPRLTEADVKRIEAKLEILRSQQDG